MFVFLFSFLLGVGAVVGAVIAARKRIGFLAQTPEDYASNTPTVDIRKHLAGPMVCEGVLFGPMGRVVSRFTARMNGSWDGDTGRLTEDFLYDSGATQARVWSLSVDAQGQITGTADDVIGTATGRQVGNAVRLDYTLRLPPHAGGHVLEVTDWLYLVGTSTLVNRSQFRKFGIPVGELVATLRPA